MGGSGGLLVSDDRQGWLSKKFVSLNLLEWICEGPRFTRSRRSLGIKKKKNKSMDRVFFLTLRGEIKGVPLPT